MSSVRLRSTNSLRECWRYTRGVITTDFSSPYRSHAALSKVNRNMPLPHSTENARKCKDGSPFTLVVTLQHKLKKWNAIFGQDHPKERVLFSTSEILSLQITFKKFLQQATALYRQCVHPGSVKTCVVTTLETARFMAIENSELSQPYQIGKLLSQTWLPYKPTQFVQIHGNQSVVVPLVTTRRRRSFICVFCQYGTSVDDSKSPKLKLCNENPPCIHSYYPCESRNLRTDDSHFSLNHVFLLALTLLKHPQTTTPSLLYRAHICNTVCMKC